MSMTVDDNRSPAQSALDTLLTGLRNQASPDELETWKNATRGSIVLKRFSESGHLIEVMLHGGRQVQLTPRERRINAEAAASTKLNPFANGRMQPVRLIETEADTAEIAANPNIMGETAIVDMFKERELRKFVAKVEGVDNTLLLGRMLEVAKSDAVNASVKQLAAIENRITALQEAEAPVDEVASSARPVA